MIWNVLDRRSRPYRWKRINAIIEPVWHDNACADADQAPEEDGDVFYEEREGISVADAIAWANAFSTPVTLYLYDEGQGTAGLSAHSSH